MLNSREFSNMVRKIQTISKATLKATEEKKFLVKKNKKKIPNTTTKHERHLHNLCIFMYIINPNSDFGFLFLPYYYLIMQSTWTKHNIVLFCSL